MSEWTLVGQVGLTGLLLTAFGLLYTIGGRHYRILRWLVGGVVFAAGCAGLALAAGVWRNPMWLSFVFYPASLSSGYGGEDAALGKLRRRAYYGLLVGVASGTFLLPMGLWGPWLFQVGLAMAASVFFGLTNPTSAVGEEGAISLLLVGTVPFLLIR